MSCLAYEEIKDEVQN